MLRNILVFLFILNCLTVVSQEKKIIEATKIDNPPKIDGILDDVVWLQLPFAENFFMYDPGNEGTIPEGFETKVKMAYDDRAIYLAAYMYDPNPSEIFTQFSQRDEIFVQADHFSIALNTYNDGINESHFFVTSAGTIGDAIATQNDFDFSHNVVFECKISKDLKGWYAEFKIPYNALRFPELDEQNWAVNFYRKIISQNQTHTWNFIDKTKGNESQYSGLVTGIRNINPPVRLTLFPFVQGVVANFDGKTETDFSAGMDLKYGLSDSFTLDATLIPDFGQSAFDEVTLNLGPFEQIFDENRPFFTEGVDLFRKGRVFFSRRVGGAPSGEVGALEPNEHIIENPERVNLLNAIKISGRTKTGLGVGFFNAITEKTYASIEDTITKNRRKVLVEPLTNYNILVFDQQFNGNSSVSIINTNVTRENDFRDANTSAFVFDLADKGNKFRSSGRAVMSNVSDVNGNSSGFRSELDIFRIKGKFRYRIGHDFANETYDINDFGISNQNNYNNFVAGTSYQIFEPTKTFNTYRFQITARHRRLYKPSVQTRNQINFDAFFVLPTRFAFGGNIGYNSKDDNYFEPRVAGRYVTYGSRFSGEAWLSSDYRKKLAIDLRLGYTKYFDGDPRRPMFLRISPRYRFSEKFLVVLSSEFSKIERDFGYVEDNDTGIFFGQRERTNIENSIQASFNFDPYKAIDLSFRNFWSTADYSENIFFELNDNGSLTTVNYDTSENDPNANFNIWNLDLSFRWRFAPGSEATLLYRNQIFNFDKLSTLGYRESLNNLFDQPQQNTLSLKVTYFIDYNNVQYLFNKNS
ncbi:MAG: hypothetical protein ACI9M9_001646 [Flavobacteriaceae bacterium]|jgi:hypothetical protein